MTAPILVVALANSVHTERWLEMVRGGGWPIVLLPVHEPPRPELNLTPVTSSADLARLGDDGVGVWAAPPGDDGSAPDELPAPIAHGDRQRLVRGATVARAVSALAPALVHSIELQLAGYPCLLAATRLGADFPPWLASTWGSDLCLYRKLAAHRPTLEAVLRRLDGCLNDCARDSALARELGFRGRMLGDLPGSGGVDFSRFPAPSEPPSRRRGVVIKGYHGWSGRARHVLSALHLAAPALRGWRIDVVLGDAGVAEEVAWLAADDGLDISVAPRGEHDDALRRIAGARLVVGAGISDGIGTTTLEAMALGAFPVAATSSCAAEWLRPGIDGFVVDPHDVAALSRAITTALTDDALVDAAAARNRAEVERRWDARTNRAAALAAYRAVMEAR